MEKKLIYNTQYIMHYLQEHNISNEEFCKRCNIGMDVLNDLYNHEVIDILDFVNVVEVLNITADTFLLREKVYRVKSKKAIIVNSLC